MTLWACLQVLVLQPRGCRGDGDGHEQPERGAAPACPSTKLRRSSWRAPWPWSLTLIAVRSGVCAFAARILEDSTATARAWRSHGCWSLEGPSSLALAAGFLGSSAVRRRCSVHADGLPSQGWRLERPSHSRPIDVSEVVEQVHAREAPRLGRSPRSPHGLVSLDEEQRSVQL